MLRDRFDARHGLFAMTFLDLSRREWDDLNHMCFHDYDQDKDTYKRLVLWENPNDPKDTLGLSFASRQRIEKASITHHPSLITDQLNHHSSSPITHHAMHH